MPRKFVVKHATYNTRQRMKEIQFWFIIRHLKMRQKRTIRMAKDFEYFLDNILENFCQIHDIKISIIKYAIGKANHTHYKPTHTEVALATKYLEIPVRIAVLLGGVGNKKMYDALEQYIKVDNSYDLLPKFDTEVILELEKFNKAYNHMFGLSQHVSKITSETYEEGDDPYET